MVLTLQNVLFIVLLSGYVLLLTNLDAPFASHNYEKDVQKSIFDQDSGEQINDKVFSMSIHPSLNQSCYTYGNLKANQTCFNAKNYVASDMESCALRQAQDISVSMSSSTGTKMKKQPYWMFIGNSRIRNLYFGLCSILNGTDCSLFEIVNCRRRNGTDCDNYWKSKQWTKHGFLHYHSDFMLMQLPIYLDTWLENLDEMPDRLHIGAGVNHMKFSVMHMNLMNQEAAARAWEDAIRRVVPGLKAITKYIPVSWWISEYTLKARINKEFEDVWAWSNIDYYNAILREQLKGTGVSIMDSHVPLGMLYLESCTGDVLKNDRERCDVVHQGNECMQKYAQMYLNYACSKY